MIAVEQEAPTMAEALDLLVQSEALSAALYPLASCHISSLGDLSDDSVRFFTARSDGRAVGCGALVVADGYGEIKRMFVDPAVRCQGVGRAILDAIEKCARHEGLDVLRLETGVRNHEAVVLYERAGYERRGPFGSYQPDPLSIFMEKRLA